MDGWDAVVTIANVGESDWILEPGFLDVLVEDGLSLAVEDTGGDDVGLHVVGLVLEIEDLVFDLFDDLVLFNRAPLLVVKLCVGQLSISFPLLLLRFNDCFFDLLGFLLLFTCAFVLSCGTVLGLSGLSIAFTGDLFTSSSAVLRSRLFGRFLCCKLLSRLDLFKVLWGALPSHEGADEYEDLLLLALVLLEGLQRAADIRWVTSVQVVDYQVALAEILHGKPGLGSLQKDETLA